MFLFSFIFGVCNILIGFYCLGRKGQELTAGIWSCSALPGENGDSAPLQVQCQDQGRQWIWTHGENSLSNLVASHSMYRDIYIFHFGRNLQIFSTYLSHCVGPIFIVTVTYYLKWAQTSWTYIKLYAEFWMRREVDDFCEIFNILLMLKRRIIIFMIFYIDPP